MPFRRVVDVRCEAGRKIMKLQREKEITAVDSETGSTEEFIVIYYISVEEKFALVVEAKRLSAMDRLRDSVANERYVGQQQ